MESIKAPNSDAISTSTGEHPLLIPEIVENVVKNLDPSFEQLKTLRLVSKTWTEATLPLWRKSGAVLTLVPDPPLFEKSDYKTGIQVSKFLTEFQDPDSPFQLSKNPFEKYKLKDIPINLNKCSKPGGRHNTFWTIIGPLMKSVHLYKCKFTTPGLCPVNSLKQLVVQMVPHLQHLQLTETLNQVLGRSPECKILGGPRPVEVEQAVHSNLRTLSVCDPTRGYWGLEEILEVTPELETIRTVDQSGADLDSFLLTIIRVRLAWNSAHQPRPLSNLKHLDLMNSFGVLDTETLWWRFHPHERAPVGIQLPLETLAIHLNAFKEQEYVPDRLNKFLNSLSSTLKTLKAFQVPNSGGEPYFKFLSNCSMNLLTELYLWGTMAQNFEFLRETPNLKKLKIDLGCFEKRDIVLELLKRNNKWNASKRMYEKYQCDMALNVRDDWKDGILCTELEYLEIDFEFPEGSLRLMGKWMPNLRTLKTILNEGTVPVVCEIWRDLTELVCLHGSKIGSDSFVRRRDEGMSGFSGGAGPKLKICDFAGLERFQLDAYCGEAELTDEAIFNGFLKMTSLKYLEICVNSQMSEEAEAALRKGIQFCKVFRDDQCARIGVDPSGLKAGERSGCDRCDFRRINEIHGFEHDYIPLFPDSDEDSVGGSGDSDN